jgi:Fe-S oxidoreductase
MTELTIVASANPGCAMHLTAGGATVMHPLDIVDELLGSTGGRR